VEEGLRDPHNTYTLTGIAPVESPIFIGVPKMPEKKTKATNSGILFASEWQVFSVGVDRVAWNGTNLEQIDVIMSDGTTIHSITPVCRLDVAQTISGVKTFAAEPVFDDTIAGNKSGVAKNDAHFIATEKQVYDGILDSFAFDTTQLDKLIISRNNETLYPDLVITGVDRIDQ
jgi:hypothetical protein